MIFITCIVGLITEDTLYIGGDRLATTSTFGRKFHMAEEKVWKKGPHMIFGAAGSARGCQLLAYNAAIPPMKEGQLLYEYLINEFTLAMKDALISGGELQTKHGVQIAFNQFILGFKGRLFTFYPDFGFEEVKEQYTAVGSGEEYALGSFHTTRNMELEPEERVTMALEAARYHNAYVEGPFDIISLPREGMDPVNQAMDRILEKANQSMEKTE